MKKSRRRYVAEYAMREVVEAQDKIDAFTAYVARGKENLARNAAFLEENRQMLDFWGSVVSGHLALPPGREMLSAKSRVRYITTQIEDLERSVDDFNDKIACEEERIPFWQEQVAYWTDIYNLNKEDEVEGEEN